MVPPEISRRDFIKSAAATTGAAAVGALSPSAVLGANDRINVAVIGVGGMGGGHLGNLLGRAGGDNVRVVGVCDVYQKRLSAAMERSKAEGVMDYRKLIERDDIDAVLIATPDHWHSRIAIDALESGKHVYVEKPMTHTVQQAIDLRNAVRRTKGILQVGPQATSDGQWWAANSAIQKGRIGKTVWAQSSYNRNSRECVFNRWFGIDEAASPKAAGNDYVDWDMWLGHKWGLAPKIPWNPEHFFRFRKYWPYNGGVATDLLYHRLAPMLIALAGPDGEYPRRVSASGGLYTYKDGRDIPDTFMVTIEYPSEYSVFLICTLNNDTNIPTVIYGKHGTMNVEDGPSLRVNSEFGEEFRTKNEGLSEVKLSSTGRRDMIGSWLDTIRGNGRLNCNVELGTATMVAIKMAVESYRKNKVLFWDPKKEEVIG